MRILLAPTNIGNQGQLQAAALRARGHEAEFWQLGKSAFSFAHDRQLEWPTSSSEALALFSEIALADYDVIHFHFGRSLTPKANPLGELWDLALWRQLNVRLIMSFHGTEMRDAEKEKQLDRWSYYHFGAPHNTPEVLAKRLGAIRQNVDAMTVSAGSNFLHVPDANYLPLAVDTEAIQPAAPPSRVIPVIAHAPSRRSTKGTDFVLAALDTLQAQGVQFEVDLIEGVDNAEVIRRISNADIVIEKVLGDGYGVTALEAFAAGRPVVTRATERATKWAPGFPGVSADPDTLVTTLRALVESPSQRVAIGAASREFAVEHHGLAAVGRALERLYTDVDVVPPAVSSDPRSAALAQEVAHLRSQNLALASAKEQASASAAREKKARQSAQRVLGYRVQRRILRAFGRKL